jgi:hypothetical protein
MHSHPIDYLSLSISLGIEGVDFVNLVSIMEHRLDQKILMTLLYLLEITVFGNPKVNPNMLKEESSNALYCDVLLVGCQNCHLTKLINNHKKTILTMLG